MAYLIHRKEPVDREIRRVLSEQAEQARSRLSHWHENPQASIHQARQAFKRIRALLRLVRPGAPYVFRVENRIFRSLGRDLGYARDAQAVVDAVGVLDARASAPAAVDSLKALRLGLEGRAARERRGGNTELSGRVALACDDLAAALRRVRDMPLHDLRRRDLRRGVEASRQRCASAFQRAAGTRASQDLHRWRGEVKYLFNQSRLMREIMPGWTADASPVLDVLGRHLGQHHDLVVLSERLSGGAGDLVTEAQLRVVLNAVREAEAELAETALASGAGLFRAARSESRSNVLEFPARA